MCNPYDINNCSWDNGLPLNDGGASRAHTHSGGGGQLPRYDFNTVDDFILGGPDSDPCQIGSVQWYFRARPRDTTGPILAPPDPVYDVIGINVTVFQNFVHSQSGFDSPAGHGNVPASGDDLNPKVADAPGGIVYARTLFNNEGAILYTLQPGFCDPPPPVGLETAAVYEAVITIDPPILLNKNVRYWLDVQGVFPFNDGLRDTLQTWWMPSQNNTLLRGRTQRTAMNNYQPLTTTPCTANAECTALVGGFCDTTAGFCRYIAWEPVETSLLTPPGTPTQRGNQGAVAPCAALPLRTRFDFAFKLNGVKDPPGIPNDLCANAVEAFNGVTPFDTTGAGTDGPAASCGSANQDLWFRHTAACTGRLLVDTCSSSFDSIVVLYSGTTCAPLGSQAECDDNNDACEDGSDDARIDHRSVVAGQTFLIRVGGIGAAQGEGLLTIRCEEPCGALNSADCCAPELPFDLLGCMNETCCEQVCAINPSCCGASGGAWDNVCASAAAGIPACHCPCSFTCPGGAIAEVETCGQNSNGGCDDMAEPYQDILCGQTVCGTVRADGSLRDIDWYRFNVSDGDADDEAEITLNLNGSAPVGAFIYDSTDCNNLVEFASVATASCQTRTLTACVPAPGVYTVVVSTFQTVDNDEVGDVIFDGFPCASQNDYKFTLTCDDNTLLGACCTCVGGCADGHTECECRDQGGTFQGAGTLCASVSGQCQAHGCQNSVLLTCPTSTVPVDLTSVNHPPDEPYACGNTGHNPNDSAWFHFVATSTTASLRTCNSVGSGRDSLLAVYSGSCCSPGDPLVTEACSDDVCGFTDLLSRFCVTGLSPGLTYYVQVSNWADPVNGLYTLDLDCPCGGACCDTVTGICTDDVPLSACQGPEDRFSLSMTCATLSPPCDCNSNGVPDFCDISCGSPAGPCDLPGCGLSQDCNNNIIPDACDISSGLSADCNTNSIPDSCDIANCTPGNPACDDCNVNGVPDACDITACGPADPDCGDCNVNSVPDACDIDACAPADPDCDDCNVNSVPDACDISFETSMDVNPEDGIPDDCVTAFADNGCIPPSNDWTCGGNWPLGGTNYPDNQGDPNTVSDLAVTLNAVNLFLDDTVELDGLRIVNDAVLNVTQSGAEGDLIIAAPGALFLEGTLLAGPGRVIDVSGGVMRVQGRGYYGPQPTLLRGDAEENVKIRRPVDQNAETKESAIENRQRPTGLPAAIDNPAPPAQGGPVCGNGICEDGETTCDCPMETTCGACLAAQDMVISNCAPCSPGMCDEDTSCDIILTAGSTEALNVTGYLLMDGLSTATGAPVCPCCPCTIENTMTCGGGFLRGAILPPPKFRANLGTQSDIAGDLTLQGTVDLYYGSNNNLNLAGNFDNRLTTPACFDWSTSGMTLVGLASRTFEAAGRDLGNSLDGFFYGPDTNFSLGELEVAAGRSVTLINEKYNTVGVGNLQDMNSCLEALYVHHLILRAGSTLTLNRARIYYEMLTQESGATIVQQGCAQAREVAPCSNADACGDGNVCTVDACNAGTCENVPIASLAYGDTAYTGEGSVVDVDDILCVLDAFAGIFSNCPVERADLTPCNIAACTTDDDCAALGAPCVQGRCHLLDVDDILAVLDAFVGLPGCPDPCP